MPVRLNGAKRGRGGTRTLTGAVVVLLCACSGDELPEATPDLQPIDYAEDVAATWDVGEATGQTIQACSPMKRGKVALAADSAHRRVGATAARIDYGPNGMNYLQAVYPRTRDGSWDATVQKTADFWIDAQLPGSYMGWDPIGPTLVLCNAAGKYRRLDPDTNRLPREIDSWTRLRVPLAGGDGWKAQDVGGFDPRAVKWVEFHVDPYRNNGTGTCRLWIDGLRLE